MFFVAPRARDVIGAEFGHIVMAGDSLMYLLTAIRQHPVVFPASAIQKCCQSCKSYHVAMVNLGEAFKPKDHMMKHMCHSAAFLGSPALYGNWQGEV